MKWLFLLLPLLLLPSLYAQRARSGGISIHAQQMKVEASGERLAEGNVRISQQGVFLLTADVAVYDGASGSIKAHGNVKIDFETGAGLIEVTAQELNYFVESGTGSLNEVTAWFGDAFFFQGQRMEIEENGNVFIIRDGGISACNQATPQWSLRIKRARVRREGYAFVSNARFRVKNLPVVYIPYLVVPVMTERKSGLLTPSSGRSERNGSFYSQPFYWAPRRDLDFTITPSYFKEAGFNLDLETRYRPKDNLSGTFLARYYNDRVLERLERAGDVPLEDGEPINPDRFRINWDHSQTFFKGDLDIWVEGGSDFNVDRDFLQDTLRSRIRDYHYAAAWQRALGRNVLQVRVNRMDRILSQGEEVFGLTRLPEIRFYQPNYHLGRGFFLRNHASMTLFDFEDLGPSRLDDRVIRIGLDGELSKTQNLGPYIHTRWGAGYQGAWYQRDTADAADQDDSDVRGGAFGFLEIVGPRLQRAYRIAERRMVHALDLAVTMRQGERQNDPFFDAVLLDELDIRITEQNKGFRTGWKMSSRFFIGEPGRARPLLDVEMSQDIDFDRSGQPNDDIVSRFRLLNLRGFHANGTLELNPDQGKLDALTIYSGVNRGQWRGYGGYVERRGETETDQRSFIGISQWSLPRWRSRFKVSVDYDLKQDDIKSQEYLYGYQGQCVGFNLKYVKSFFDSSVLGNKDFFQITVNLRNLGELGTKF